MNELEIRNKTIAARVIKPLLKEFPRYKHPAGNRLYRLYMRLIHPEREQEKCRLRKQKWVYKPMQYKQWNRPRERLNQINRNLRIQLLHIIGDKCSNNECGYNRDFRALQIDHINGRGSRERKLHGLSSMYSKYISNPELAKKELQILCANCNVIKRVEEKEFGVLPMRRSLMR